MIDTRQIYCSFTNLLKEWLTPLTCSQQTQPLSTLCQAGKIRICKVTGDRRLCARMAAMGVYPGSDVELLCPESGGQCILKIHGGRVCLDRSLSENILVSSN